MWRMSPRRTNWVTRASNATLIQFIEQLDSANASNKPSEPRGNALSGGERQRVALARAVLQRPSLFLLDESTSALDAPSERRIFTSLAHYFSNQTMLFISHLISVLKWVDRVVVLNQGMVEDQGTQEQLIGRSDLYSCLQGAVTPALYTQTRYPSAR